MQTVPARLHQGWVRFYLRTRVSLHAKRSFFFILSLSHYELIQPWYSDKDRLQSSQCYAARYTHALRFRCKFCCCA